MSLERELALVRGWCHMLGHDESGLAQDIGRSFDPLSTVDECNKALAMLAGHGRVPRDTMPYSEWSDPKPPPSPNKLDPAAEELLNQYDVLTLAPMAFQYEHLPPAKRTPKPFDPEAKEIRFEFDTVQYEAQDATKAAAAFAARIGRSVTKEEDPRFSDEDAGRLKRVTTIFDRFFSYPYATQKVADASNEQRNEDEGSEPTPRESRGAKMDGWLTGWSQDGAPAFEREPTSPGTPGSTTCLAMAKKLSRVDPASYSDVALLLEYPDAYKKVLD